MINEEKRKLITELQSQGLKLVNRDREASTVRSRGASGRTGGAGPSDHKAITVDGTTVMIPVYNDVAADSPYSVGDASSMSQLSLQKYQREITSIEFPQQPKFYNLKTADGIPYNQIA